MNSGQRTGAVRHPDALRSNALRGADGDDTGHGDPTRAVDLWCFALLRARPGVDAERAERIAVERPSNAGSWRNRRGRRWEAESRKSRESTVRMDDEHGTWDDRHAFVDLLFGVRSDKHRVFGWTSKPKHDQWNWHIT